MYDFEHFDFYELLGVPRNASADDIKKGYRQQVARYHPDRYANAPDPEQAYASERTRRINEAYRVLSDFSSRSAYNRGQITPFANRSSVNQRAKWSESPRAMPRRTAAPRDHQSELYEQARTHLQAGRYVQAAATLRELQQMNPFYRDSATLLAQAEAALERGESSPPRETFAEPFKPMVEQPRPVRKMLLFGGSGVAVVLVLVALLTLPRFQATGMDVSTSALVATRSPTTEPTAAPAENSASTQPTISTGETAEIASPTTQPAESALLPTSEPIMEPTALPTSEPTLETPTEPPPDPTVAPTETPTAAPTETSTVLPTSSPTSEPGVTTSPPPPTAGIAERGSVLFTDDFSVPSGWAQTNGVGWEVGYTGAGNYRVLALAGARNIWSYRTGYEVQDRYSLGCDLQVLSGEAGLVLYFLDRENYLTALINPARGTYRLEQYSAGSMQILSEGDTLALQPGSGVTNRLVTRMNVTQMQLFVNNQLLADVGLQGITPTNVYGVVTNGRDGNGEALFDNIAIRTLE